MKNIKFDEKLNIKQTVELAHLVWPKLLKPIKSDFPYRDTPVNPLLITKRNIFYKKRPHVGIPGRGCVHHLNGGCTMCSYRLRNNKISYGDIKKQIINALNYLKKENRYNIFWHYYGFGTGGSFYDPSEIPSSIRKIIYKEIRKDTPKGIRGIFNVGTRLEFINEKVLREARHYLGKSFKIIIGYGLESTNTLIREACVNKVLPSDWRDKITLLKKYDVQIFAHILVKPPFLTEEEAVQDVIRSVSDVYKQKLAHGVAVMTMSSRPRTIIRKLEEEGDYTLPSIWSIIRIINELGPEICQKTTFNGLAWKKNHHNIKSKDKHVNLVRGCSQCSSKLMPLLLNFKSPNTKEEWKNIVDTADGIQCRCKNNYEKKIKLELKNKDLKNRIVNGLNKLSLNMQGKNLSELLKTIKK